MVQWGACLGSTVLAGWLHIVFLFNGGPLWRDEVSSLHVANLPSLTELWQSLDSPALFPLALRGWCALGLGHDDLALRGFGLLVGLAILVALWVNARIMGLGAPLVSVGLLSANMTLVRWGDSLRAYGLGSLFMLLAAGQLWALIRAPGRRHFIFACLTAILSVQCLYQNAFLLAAGCGAGFLVCLSRGNSRTAALVLAVGLAAALSLLPYAAALAHSGTAWRVLRVGFSPRSLWSNLSEALGSPLFGLRWVWILLVFMAGSTGVATLGRQGRRRQITPAALSLFGASAACFGVVAYLLMLVWATLPTQPWYYLPLMTFVAFCLDASLVQRFVRRPVWCAAFSVLIPLLSLPFALPQAAQRQTNIDQIAGRLHAHAGPEDFVIVYPWYCGVTFQYYYHGQTPWTTLPALADHRLHRYDLLAEKLAASAPIQDVLDRALRTVASGHV